MEILMKVVRGKPHGQYLRFPQGEFVIGRGPECHVRPNCDWVSRQHCLLKVGAQSIMLSDLGSTNGTLVNGTLVKKEQELHNGDQIQVGPLVLEVVLGEAAMAETLINETALVSMEKTLESPLKPHAAKVTDHMPDLPAGIQP